MSKGKDHGGKSGHQDDHHGRDSGHKDKDHGHHDSGHKGKVHVFVGTKGNDVLAGTDGKDIIVGGKGDDQIDGRGGNDLLLGGKGDDLIFGGAGNDFVFGGKGDDQLDGGAGSDFVKAGKGDDLANFTLSENFGAHNAYDGGKGFDTLQLTLTHAEFQLASVQQDIAAFKAFIAHKANSHGDSGKTFQFTSFDLDVRNFEDLKIVLLNAPPVAHDDSYSLDEDTQVSVAGPGVAANDTDAEGAPLLVVLVSGPTHGVLTLNADGSFAYAPDGNFNGSDTFTYKVNDGALDSNVATVTLNVAPVNDPPEAADDAFEGDEDRPIILGVLANDSDVDGDSLTARIVDGPTHGALTPNADGTLTYTPGENFNGGDSFTYVANDGALNSNVATVDLTINAVNDAPTAENDLFESDEDMAVSGNVLDNDNDVDGDALTATKLTDPANGTLVFNADGTFTYTPDADWFGVDSFTYKLNDGAEDSSVATVTLDVAPVNDAPVAADDVIPGPGGGAVSVAVVGSSASTYLEAAAQLQVMGKIVATAIPVTQYSTLEQWKAAFAAYDVVVIGENGGLSSDYDGTQIFAALREFVDLGGGVVTTGVFAGKIAAYTGQPTQDDADYISPAGSSGAGSVFALSGDAIEIVPLVHPITAGIANFELLGPYEFAAVTDGTATVLATVLGTDGADHTAIAYDEVGLGRTVFLGAVHMATVETFMSNLTRSGILDQIFEQAVVWSAGNLGSSATTDEDTIYVIDDAIVLTNDTDIEGNTLSVFSVSAASTLGAAVSINGAGDIVYDPTAGLQYLAAGQIETDSFEYTVSDGNGGFDTARVTLTVAGRNDAPTAANDSRLTNEDTVVTGNVLVNDEDVDELDTLTVTTAGTFLTARGASVILGADGTYSYDPTGSAELQALGAGTSVIDTFGYSIGDGNGGSDSATVSVTVIGLAEDGGSGASAKVQQAIAPGTELEYVIRFGNGEWLELGSFSMGLDQMAGSGGTKLGRLTAEDVLSTLGSGKQIVTLSEALSKGTVLNEVQIGAYYQSGEGTKLVDAFSFGQVQLTSLDTNGDAQHTSNQVGFDFGSFAHKHLSYDQTGKLDSAVAGDWSLTGKNAPPANAPGDLDKGLKLGESLSTDVQLDYYVHFEGLPTNEWLRLEDFSMGLNAAFSSTGGVGKTTVDPVNLLLGSSASIVHLTDALAGGSVLKGVEIEAYYHGGQGKPQLVDQYYFGNASLSSLDTNNASSNALSFAYTGFGHGHVEYDPNTGASKGITEVEFDLGGKSFNAPPIHGDVDFF